MHRSRSMRFDQVVFVRFFRTVCMRMLRDDYDNMRLPMRERCAMEDSTSAARRVHVSESGRILTSDEAALLRKCLLEQDGRSASDKEREPFLKGKSSRGGMPIR